MSCTYHADDKHRTLITLFDAARPDVVEHTCVCWVPRQMGDGKLLVDRREPQALERRVW